MEQSINVRSIELIYLSYTHGRVWKVRHLHFFDSVSFSTYKPYFTEYPETTILQPRKNKNTNIRMYHPWASLTDGGLYDLTIGIIGLSLNIVLEKGLTRNAGRKRSVHAGEDLYRENKCHHRVCVTITYDHNRSFNSTQQHSNCARSRLSHETPDERCTCKLYKRHT